MNTVLLTSAVFKQKSKQVSALSSNNPYKQQHGYCNIRSTSEYQRSMWKS